MAYDKSAFATNPGTSHATQSVESFQEYGTAEGTPQSPVSPLEEEQRHDGSCAIHQEAPFLPHESTQSVLSRGHSEDSLDDLDYVNAKDAPDPPKSVFYLFILALSVGGLTMTWAVETSAGTPYLQSLGMSKSLLALVWIAGPLGGVLVQPYVGIRSDNCRIRWGKRLPFMVGGAIATAVSFLCLSWAREIVHGILGIFGARQDSEGVKVCTIVFATMWVYVLDFAINAVQAGIRAFIVDNAPYHQQEEANAWAGRLTGVGNIIIYFCGYIHLPRLIPWLGKTQMQILCALAAISICVTVSISAAYIRERDPTLEGPPSKNPGLLAFFKQTFQSAVRMPIQIQKVCIAQFFNWLGWFGFLFYITTYIGQIRLNPYFSEHPDLNPEKLEDLWEDATRHATFALFIFAITSFIANMLLPFFVVPSYNIPSPESQSSIPLSNANGIIGKPHYLNISWFRSGLDGFLAMLQIPGLTLRRTWILSHFMFALLMFSTFLVNSYVGAVILTAFIGIPWAVSLWAPFALISAEISKRDTEARLNATRNDRSDGDFKMGKQDDQAGVILGLHNVAVSAPQILATIISSIIFKFSQKERGEPDDTSVAWVLRFGGLAALVAAYCTYRIDEEGDAQKAAESSSRYERVMGEENRELPNV